MIIFFCSMTTTQNNEIHFVRKYQKFTVSDLDFLVHTAKSIQDSVLYNLKGANDVIDSLVLEKYELLSEIEDLKKKIEDLEETIHLGVSDDPVFRG